MTILMRVLATAIFFSCAGNSASAEDCTVPDTPEICADERMHAMLDTVLRLYAAVETAALDQEMVAEDRQNWLTSLAEADDPVWALRGADARLRSALGSVAMSREARVYAPDLREVCLTLGYQAVSGGLACTVKSFGPLEVLTPREGNDWYVMQTQAFRGWTGVEEPGTGEEIDAGERGFVVFEPVLGSADLLRPIHAEVQLGQINPPFLVDTPLGEAIVGDTRTGRFLLRRDGEMRPFETDPELRQKAAALFPDMTVRESWIDFATLTLEVHLVAKDAGMGDDGGFERVPLALVDGRLILASEGP